MPLIKWNPVIEPFEIKPDAAAPNTPVAVDKPWILVVSGMQGYTHLRITGEGSWTQSGDSIGDCVPDGLLRTSVQVGPLAVANCGVGALIGKLGGSSAALAMPPSGPAGNPPPPGMLAEGTAFAIGSHCIVTLPANFMGPLYIGFNGLAWPFLVKKLKVTVDGAGTTPS